jgi:mandelate racemase
MRIRSVEARAVVAPLEPPIRTASGHVTQAPILLIDLTADEGVVGRAYLFGYHAFTLGPLHELVIALGDSIKGDVVAPVDLDKKLRARMALFGTRGLQGMAVAGLDMAAWDALAVAAGVPLVALLGGQPRAIAAYNSLGMIPPAEAADAASKTVAAGFKALKVKIGWPTLAEDLAVVRAARKALGDDIALMVDFNQSLTQPEAIRRGRALDGEGIAWIEEPVRADDFRGAAAVAAQVRDADPDRGELQWPVRDGARAVSGGERSRHARSAADRRRDRMVARGGAGAYGRPAMFQSHLHRGERAPARRDADVPLHRIPRCRGARPRRAAAPGRRDDRGARAPRDRARVERGRRAAISREVKRPEGL